MKRAARVLERLLGRCTGLVPPGRRGWVEAVRAEAGEVPAGRARAGWLAGGLWLVAREAKMIRRIGYGLGVVAVAVAAALAVRYLWDGAHAGRDAGWDKARIVLLVALLAGLPWVARRRQVFGPVGPSIAARAVRAVGSAVIVALVLDFARIEHFPEPAMGGVLNGAGDWNWGREAVALILIAVGLAAILIIPVRRPKVHPVLVAWCAVAATLILFFTLAPLQVLITVYAAGLLAVTSRRSPASPATLTLSTTIGVGGGLLMVALWNPLQPGPNSSNAGRRGPIRAAYRGDRRGNGRRGSACSTASGRPYQPAGAEGTGPAVPGGRPADRRQRRADAPPVPGQPRGPRRRRLPGDTAFPLHRRIVAMDVLPRRRAHTRPGHGQRGRDHPSPAAQPAATAATAA